MNASNNDYYLAACHSVHLGRGAFFPNRPHRARVRGCCAQAAAAPSTQPLTRRRKASPWRTLLQVPEPEPAHPESQRRRLPSWLIEQAPEPAFCASAGRLGKESGHRRRPRLRTWHSRRRRSASPRRRPRQPCAAPVQLPRRAPAAERR